MADELPPNSMLQGIRKFSLAAFFACAGTIGLFAEKLTGSEFLLLVSAILSIYGMANVANTIGGKKQ